MISDGIDRSGGPGPANPYVDTVIEDAQKTGVIIHAIYANGAGHYSRNFWLMNSGLNDLSEIAEEHRSGVLHAGDTRQPFPLLLTCKI